MRLRRIGTVAIAMLLVVATANVTLGYSVLTHEAIIDSMWEKDIAPVILERFPTATVEELREAHAHAYGGAIIQDMGYYPFGSRFFSDLAHYVRSGDFVQALLRESQDMNEYAFALGALCHYVADNDGHPMATNLSVPLLYPKVRRQFGNNVTYDQNPGAHVQTEFGFDVIMVAHGHYASEQYHDFIGFKVSKPLLERAFKDTYGIELKSIFTNLDLALGTYRRCVSSLIPEMTKVAWETKKGDIEKETPGATRQKFLYNLSKASYHKEWGDQYQKPGVFAKILSVLFRMVPKVGPFKALAIKPSTPETEKLFMRSFDTTVTQYRESLGQVRAGHLDLPNKDFDTGKATSPGEYRLADKAYAHLLDIHSDHNFETVGPDLRENILAFYSDSTAPLDTKKDSKNWQKAQRELSRLREARVSERMPAR
jgi:hypothetical protein